MLETIAQMKGNVVAFHTYPTAAGSIPEPAVWLGIESDVNADGTVKTGYQTSWSTTYRNGWGYTAANTSTFPCGASIWYEHECFGHPLQSGLSNLCPVPVSQHDAVTLFNGVGELWQDAFGFAHELGVKTILGTEMPMSPPPLPPGTLQGLQVWYSSSRNDHFVTTTACAECNGLYAYQGVVGYIYGDNSSQPGLIALSTYFSSTYSDNVLTSGPPPDSTYGFVRVEGYALPANSSGSNTAALVQTVNGKHHFAVSGAGWLANATAEGFTVSSPLATVWATGPPAPTTQDLYEGAFTRLDRLLGDKLDWYWVWTPEEWEWSLVNISNALVQNAVVDSLAVQAAHDAVGASFQLATCGWVVGPLGVRWYFDTVLPSTWAMSSIDMDLGNTDVDPSYANLTHRTSQNKWVIPWVEDDPGLTAPQLWLNRTLSHAQEAVNYGVGGLLLIHWRTRATGPQIAAAHAWAWNQSITAQSYWSVWCRAQFGSAVGSAAAGVFTAMDSFNMPRPVSWINGPGALSADPTQCSFATEYAWVDSFVALRNTLLASIASGTDTLSNLEAFDYWGNQFQYMRSVAQMECAWAGYNDLIGQIQNITDPTQRQKAAIAQGLPARVALVSNVTAMLWQMLSSITGVEGIGTIHNIVTHSLPGAIGDGPSSTLEGLTGQPLPPAAYPPMTYDPLRAPSLRVQTVRTILAVNESFPMRAVVLTTPTQAPLNVTLYTRTLGTGPFQASALTQAAPVGGAVRFVYTVTLPPPTSDIEWYLHAVLPPNSTAYRNGLGIPAGTYTSASSVDLYFPPTAPSAPASIVLL